MYNFVQAFQNPEDRPKLLSLGKRGLGIATTTSPPLQFAKQAPSIFSAAAAAAALATPQAKATKGKMRLS